VRRDESRGQRNRSVGPLLHATVPEPLVRDLAREESHLDPGQLYDVVVGQFAGLRANRLPVYKGVVAFLAGFDMQTCTM
jgi:hypothetical protein